MRKSSVIQTLEWLRWGRLWCLEPARRREACSLWLAMAKPYVHTFTRRLKAGLSLSAAMIVFALSLHVHAMPESCWELVEAAGERTVPQISEKPPWILEADQHFSVYSVHRDKIDYDETFGPRYEEATAALRKGQVYMDFGAGDFYALTGYLERKKNDGNSPTAVGLVFKFPYDFKASNQAYEVDRFVREHRLHVMSGELFENIHPLDLPVFDVGSDYYGPDSYTEDLSFTLNRQLSKMRRPLESELYIAGNEPFPDRDFRWPNGDPSDSTIVVTKSGEIKSFFAWLLSQPGLITEIYLRPRSRNHDDRTQRPDLSIRILKRYEESRVPNLRLVVSSGGSPPGRIFVEDEASLDLPESTLYQDAHGRTFMLGSHVMSKIRRRLQAASGFQQ